MAGVTTRVDGVRPHTGRAAPKLAELIAERGVQPDYDDLVQASEGLMKPVVLRGLCAEAVSDAEWTLDQMLTLDPQALITVEHYPDGDRRKAYQRITRPFKELVEPMKADPEKWFIAERDFDQEFSAVAAELPRLSVLPDGARSLIRLVFFGVNSQSATHFHVRDQAILAHLRGHKRIILTPPSTTKQMATNSPFGGRPQFSTHGPEVGEDALDCFRNLVGEENTYVVNLEPGDGLFIPVHWWHWAEGFGENLSVTSFWRASMREWTFPAPGMRAATAVTLATIATAVRSLKISRNQ